MTRIELKNLRRAFFRGETAPLNLLITNAGITPLTGAEAVVEAPGATRVQTPLPDLPPNASASLRLVVDTRLLKAGEYVACCRVVASGRAPSAADFAFWVARRWNQDRMRVWLWPHSKFGVYTLRFDDLCREQLRWYASQGFNSFQPYGELDDEKIRLFDYAMTQGWEMGVRLNGAYKGRYEMGCGPEAHVSANPAAQFHGHREKVFNDPFHPDVARWQNDDNAAVLAKVRDLPGVKTCFFNSEVEDGFNQLEAPNARRALEAAPAPVAPHQFILPGVIADNDAGYARRLYLFKQGDGLAAANRRAADMAHRVRPDLICFTDPCRLTTALDRFSGMDLVSTWTYTNPDPKLMLFIETLVAQAKPRRQGVMHTVTLLNYAGSIAPKETGWTLMGPDRLVETLWINLSRASDGLGLYLSSSCDPFDMPAPEGVKPFWSSEQKEPWQKHPPTWEAMRAFSRDVLEPFGPMIRKLGRAPRKAAVLSSEASRLYRASPKLTGYYDNYQIYHFYTLLAMCHVPADVVFDETIAEEGLEAYDALFLPHCETLPQTVYNRILDFERRGGLVVTDQYFRAPVPNTVKTEFDFVYRRGVTATAIRDNTGHINWGDDHLDVNTAPKGELKGVAADEDQRTLEKYAAELRRILDGKIARDCDCSSATALLNMLESGEAKYLFVVNDKRAFDDRVGQFKAMMEKAVPQTVTVTLPGWPHPELHAYDILDQKALVVRGQGGDRLFDVDLPAPGGKIIALLPTAPARVEISAAETVSVRGAAAPFRVLITGGDGGPLPGVQPLCVTITDPQGAVSEFSGHYAAQSGAFALDFVPAANDAPGEWTIEARELISGIAATRKFTLAPA